MNKPEFKIFVSPFKGGTTSIAVALDMVGFKRWDSTNISKIQNWACGSNSLINKRYIDLISEVNKVAESFGIFEDIPKDFSLEIKKLLTNFFLKTFGCHQVADDYPLGHDFIHPYIKKIVLNDCKFIFIERPMDEYVASVKNHVLNKRYRHIFGHCRGLFGTSLGDFITAENYRRWKSRYLDLKRVFPDDVLIMDLEDGWAPLASFLGFQVPEEEFPWFNKTSVGEGVIEDSCTGNKCSHELLYCERYDAEYCPICLGWREGKCSDEECNVCRGRPERPITQGGDSVC